MSRDAGRVCFPGVEYRVCCSSHHFKVNTLTSMGCVLLKEAEASQTHDVHGRTI